VEATAGIWLSMAAASDEQRQDLWLSPIDVEQIALVLVAGQRDDFLLDR
jgi:hypothetical protein